MKRNPEIEVTGVDLASDMLAALRKKHPDKKLRLIQASYFDVDFGEGGFARGRLGTDHAPFHP